MNTHSKLGAAASEFDKAKAHVQGLNRELDLQNKKLLELKNALRNSISANGLNNVKTINLQTDIQKQIQAINQLQAKIMQSITTAFANLKGATSSADSAVLGVLGEIPHPVGRAVTALAGLPLIFKGIPRLQVPTLTVWRPPLSKFSDKSFEAATIQDRPIGLNVTANQHATPTAI